MLSSLLALPLAPAPDPYSSDYDYNYESTISSADAAGLVVLIMGIYLLIFAVAWLINGFAWAGAFSKAGHPKWKAFVPFYNSWMMVKMVGRPESHFWFLFIPYFNIYMMIVIMNDMSKSFGKETGFTVGLIFLPVVFAAILSYGDAQYRGPSYLTPEQKQYAQYYAQQQYAQAPAQQYGQPQTQQYGQQDPNAAYPQQYGQAQASNQQYGQAQAQPQYGQPQDPNQQYGQAPSQPYGQPQDPNQNPYGSGPTQ
ncbi:DUF5684 domain-containing protein [Arthrobacter sp. N199823]|uniref:DUF5684 domain-containing protein n=1 Tax=Arthrobacter sp. N199823 TaxID=2058895 RepID=UPI000CE51F6F|nr:DUF5684 domain-containing protein [Arthrobacter sp. N199823]